MIYPVTMYAAKCDRCNKEYEETHNGWSCMNDENNIWELMDNDGWQEIDEKHYCPDCVYFDTEKDEYLPKP